MFHKNNTPATTGNTPANKKEATPSIITKDMHILGNIVSDGVIDLDGTLDGNIRCNTLTLRSNGSIKGEVQATTVFIYGRIRGLIRAKNVNLFASCNVEGIIMHEAISIEDGAFVDGKFKRTDRVQADNESDSGSGSGNAFAFDDGSLDGDAKILDNIRLIR